MHGVTPAFGSLFTACWLLWPWLRVGRRLWAAVACAHVAILLWYVTAHQERYLLPLVPLMAAVVAATLALAWQQGSRVVRGLLVLLVMAQLGGAAVIPFLPTHRAHQEAPLTRGVRLLGLTTGDQRGAHDSALHAWAEVGRALPRDAVVLLHRNLLHLGIDRRVVSDVVPHQFGLSYAELGSLPAIHRELRAFGVTHVGFQAEGEDRDSLAGELLFRAFALRGTAEPHEVAGWNTRAPARGTACGRGRSRGARELSAVARDPAVRTCGRECALAAGRGGAGGPARPPQGLRTPRYAAAGGRLRGGVRPAA